MYNVHIYRFCASFPFHMSAHTKFYNTFLYALLIKHSWQVR